MSALLFSHAPAFSQAALPARLASAGSEVRLVPAPAHIAQDVDRAVLHLSKAGSLVPFLVSRSSSGFATHGLAWFFYEDPVLRAATDEAGVALGKGLGAFAAALRADMLKTTREALHSGR